MPFQALTLDYDDPLFAPVMTVGFYLLHAGVADQTKQTALEFNK